MNDPNRHTDHLTADDLRNYRDKTLSAAEQHRVERLLLENPLYADALEGLEATGQQKVELNRISDELRGRLKNRVSDPKIRRLPIWIPAAAASVVLVLSIGLYLRMQQQSELENRGSAPPPRISASKDGVSPAPPAQNQVAEESHPTLMAKPKPPLLAQKTGGTAPEDSLMLPKDHLLANSSASRAMPSAVPERIRYSNKDIDTEISGQVFDEEKRPLAGVSVRAKNADQQAVTDPAGRFQLSRIKKNDTLQLSSIGYAQQEIQAGHTGTDSIQLKPDTQALSEVVVVGYGAQAKKAVPGNMARMAPVKTALSLAPSAPANFKTYLDENRRMPPEAKEKGISGTVRVRFQVAADGSVSRFSIVKSLGYGCDEEAIRLIREGPRWTPVNRNGQPMAQFTEQDIVF